MERAVDEALRALYDYVGRPEFAGELAQARKEFFDQVGAPLPGEPIEELRLGSLTEWFIFDRPLKDRGLTPLEDYMRKHASEIGPETAEVFTGLARAVHSVFLIKKKNDRGAFLVDLYTTKKYKEVKRLHLTLAKGDMAELRLVPVGDDWHATDALCYHPYLAAKSIKKIMKKARKDNQPVAPLLIELMAINTRFERYPKTAKAKAYEEGL